jgi:hypothetical protein
MQRDKFVEALFIPYVYDCQGKEVELTDEKTSLEHGKYFVVHCDKCCNVTVLHGLRRKGEKDV